MKKRFSTLLGCLLLVAVAFASCGKTENDGETGGVTYTKNASGTAYTVTGFVKSGDTVTIDAEYEGLPVTKIAKGAFNASTTDSEDIKEFIIPKSVVEIENGAFNGCSKLEKVRYGGTVSEWLAVKMYESDDSEGGNENPFVASGNKAELYAKDEKVTSVTYATNGRVGVQLKGCASITSVTVADTATKIGAYAFANCKNLTAVVIGVGVNYIGVGAFDNCNQLDSVEFKDSQGWGYETTGATNLAQIPSNLIGDKNAIVEYILDEAYRGVWMKTSA